MRGYRHALAADTLGDLADHLERVELEDRGFAYEGAAMALCVLDFLTPWRRDRFARFLAGPAEPHVYMAHIGAGLACARLHRRTRPLLSRHDPLLGWLVLDGCGFHDGYFRWRRAVGKQAVPRRFAGYERRAFDQGLGRSLWFLSGGEPARAAATIDRFPTARRADLWSGLGLAAAYAGGAGGDALVALRSLAGTHLGDAAQGIAFAAGARGLAGNPAAHTELAAQIVCGQSAARLAEVTTRERPVVPQGPGHAGETSRANEPTSAAPLYEVWRRRVRDAVAPVG